MDTIENCPEGETRGATELVVRLIVVHLIALVAFCHFQSLRNERLVTIEPVLFLLAPFIVVVQTAVGLVVIHYCFIDSLVRSSRSWSSHISTYAHRWNILFATKPPPEPEKEEDHRRKPGEAWLNLGRLLVMSGLLFQFIATIFLYRRRWNLYGWESLSIVDHRTFELAVGGATTTFLSILLVLRLPGFVEAPLISYTQEHGTTPEQMLLFCRGDTRRCPQWYAPLYISTCVSATTATTWLLCVFSSTYEGELRWLGHVVYLHTLVFEAFNERLGLNVSVLTYYLLSCMFFILWMEIAKILKRVTNLVISDFERKHPWVAWPVLVIVGTALFSFFFVFMLLIITCISLLGFAILPAMLSGPLSIGWVKGLETQNMFSQVPFGTRDEGISCLLLWKDPVAEYLWSLV
ncbi:hypothetical protein FSPOR_4640 [Fusarium sporotrichioides]|uniref:Uncharacterized protein n=1 Tax=Fusarium sporotrichioides TaxID=5514 RepID=A0A395SAU1_FUSSP|nr:hypothetical protein FSPOR_4640 [Fusarium sporotrichioides]